MSGERGKPIYLTNGERQLVIAACEAAITVWAEVQADTNKERAHVGRLRCKQYQRIIRECIQADPQPKSQ